jgi:hypothetical protein
MSVASQTANPNLGKFTGSRVVLRLENMAGGVDDWSWEFAYWGKLELKADTALQARK